MKLRYKIASSLLLALGVAITAMALVLSHNFACQPAPSIPSGAETMHAIVHRCYGPSEVLSYEAIEKPIPANGEVLGGRTGRSPSMSSRLRTTHRRSSRRM